MKSSIQVEGRYWRCTFDVSAVCLCFSSLVSLMSLLPPLMWCWSVSSHRLTPWLTSLLNTMSFCSVCRLLSLRSARWLSQRWCRRLSKPNSVKRQLWLWLFSASMCDLFSQFSALDAVLLVLWLEIQLSC